MIAAVLGAVVGVAVAAGLLAVVPEHGFDRLARRLARPSPWGLAALLALTAVAVAVAVLPAIRAAAPWGLFVGWLILALLVLGLAGLWLRAAGPGAADGGR